MNVFLAGFSTFIGFSSLAIPENPNLSPPHCHSQSFCSFDLSPRGAAADTAQWKYGLKYGSFFKAPLEKQGRQDKGGGVAGVWGWCIV